MSYRRRRRHREQPHGNGHKPKPELLQVPPHEVARIWPLVKDLIEEGAAHGDRTADVLFEKCLTNNCQLWVIFSDKVEAAGVTSIIDTNKGYVLQFDAFAGSGMETWWPTQDEIYAWAKINGCSIARVTGRRGWERVLKEKGYEAKYIVCEKELT